MAESNSSKRIRKPSIFGKDGLPKPPCTCMHCGKSYINKRRSKTEGTVFCSRDCAYEYRREHPKAAPSFSNVFFKSCRICGGSFVARREENHICSSDCKKEYRRRYALEYDIAKHGTKECKCKICGSTFIREYGDKTRTLCSDKCKTEQLRKYRRMMKASRRARIRTTEIEQIDPFDILRRDKWTCQICGTPTPKALRGSIEDNAPEVDHIIPLAFGGGHTWANLQCACRACNQRKGATHPEEMLVYSMA